jgi:Outer membrane protein beta-barrel domain
MAQSRFGFIFIDRAIELKNTTMKDWKKYILLATVATIMSVGVAPHAKAQLGRAGIKGGLNVSNLYINNVTDQDARLGLNIGLYGQVVSNSTMALQLELLYSTKGSKAQYGGTVNQEIKYNLNYLELPVLAVFKVGDVFEIHAGGYAAYLLNADVSYSGVINGVDKINSDNLKSFDYGLSGGVGVNFGSVQVGARYNYGLAEIANSDLSSAILGSAKNSCAQLYVALNISSN